MADEIEIRVLKPKEFASKHAEPGGILRGVHFLEEGKHIIEVPKGVSTRTRTHEVAHARLGHGAPYPYPDTMNTLIDRELDAEIFSCKLMGKKPTYRNMFSVLSTVDVELEELGRKGLSKDVNGWYNYSVRKLESKGIKLSKSDKRNLYWYIKEGTRE
jgi:hypothetical protein